MHPLNWQSTGTARLATAAPLLVLAALLLLAAIPAAYAPAWTSTETVHQFTETFVDVNPCTGEPIEVTVTYNGVFHITVGPNGVHGTFTQAGTFTAVPFDASDPTFTGHFAIWGGFNLNPNNEADTFTFELRGVGTDGSVLNFHAVEHFSTNADGIVHSFSRVSPASC